MARIVGIEMGDHQLRDPGHGRWGAHRHSECRGRANHASRLRSRKRESVSSVSRLSGRVINPENTIFSVSASWTAATQSVAEERKMVPLKVVEWQNGMAMIEIQGEAMEYPRRSRP